MLGLVSLAFGFKFLERQAEILGYMDVYSKLKEELMILGIISFVTSTQTNSSWLLAFEVTHYILLFMAIGFICQAVFLVRRAVVEGRHFAIAVRTSSKDLISQFESLSKSPIRLWMFKMSLSYFPFPIRIKQYAEYKIAERCFLSKHNLPKRFQFAKYMSVMFKVRSFFFNLPFSLLLLEIYSRIRRNFSF